MRRAALRWLLVLAVGGAGLAVVLWAAGTLDRRPPEVVGWSLTQHLSDERVGLVTTGVEVTFDEPIARDSAEAAFEISPSQPGTFSWSGTTMLFTPSDALPLETAFVVRIGPGVTDLAGNRREASSDPFAFTTVGPPQLAVTSPADGATDVPLDAPVVLTFSTLMDTASVESALWVNPAVALELRWDGEELRLLPVEPLDPNRSYTISLRAGATDTGGIPLTGDRSIAFRTDAGLEPTQILPADQTDGAALGGPIALVFDEPLDPASAEQGVLRITPTIAGSVSLASLDPADATDGGLRVLRFSPAGPLPPNTTFEVEVGLALRSAEGAQLTEPIRWSFTTGAPPPSLSNQILFVSDRAGVANLWAMNPDGSNPRQISAELTPVVSYAVAPDGRGFVVGDGSRLVAYRADGTGRAVLTAPGLLEFDPAYRPDGRRLVFARADAQTGASLGLWQRDPRGGEAEPVLLPPDLRSSPAPLGPGPLPAPVLRAPRFSPDGAALAFVADGEWLAIVDLVTGVTDARIRFAAASTPEWLPDGSGVVVAGSFDTSDQARPPNRSVPPLDPWYLAAGGSLPDGLVVIEVAPDGSAPRVVISERAARPAVSRLGAVAAIRLRDAGPAVGSLLVSEPGSDEVRELLADGPLAVAEVAFAPEPGELVATRIRVHPDATLTPAGIWRIGLDGTEPQQLSADGRLPRWVP